MFWTRRRFLTAGGALASAACTPAIHPARNADVIILGAGLAGLYAARLLAEEGASVLVLEAADRIGGRMWSLNDIPGQPEAGGQQVGQSYARIRKMALDMKINIVPPPDASREKTLVIDDQTLDARDWSTSPLNSFPEAFKRAPPDSVLFVAAAQENPLSSLQDWRTIDESYDISAEDFLRQRGFDKRSLAACSIALNANDLGTYSMLNVWRSLTLFARDASRGGSENIEGGSQRLPEAMANSLPTATVRLGSPVSAIKADAAGVQVRTGSETLRASFGVCALPFPVVSNLSVDAPLNAAHQAAIHALPYTQIHQVHLALDQGPTDGLPIMMWTNSPIERVFPVRNASGETVALTCWINGQGIRSDLSDAEWSTLAETILLKTRGIKATALKVVRWDSGQQLSGGAYMHWAPGQIRAWAEPMLAPAGRLHFAGEHMSHLHTGMEGAMESAERAAIAIMQAMAA